MILQGLGHTPLFIPRTVSVLCVLCCVILFVTLTPLLQSMEGACHGQVCIVVLVVYLVLSVLAALVVCVDTCAPQPQHEQAGVFEWGVVGGQIYRTLADARFHWQAWQ